MHTAVLKTMGVIGALATAAALLAPPQAAAASATVNAINDIAITVRSDGNGPFTAEDGPGGDTGPSNGRVATHDAVTYLVSVNAVGGATDDTVFRVTAPDHTEWVTLPEPCVRPGSSIAGRTLTCSLGTIHNATIGVPVVLRVTGDAPDGTALGVSAGVESSAGTGPTVTAGAVVVSSAPRYDLSKDIAHPQLEADVPSPDGSELGLALTYPIAVRWDPVEPAHGLLGQGAVPGAFTFEDDVSQLTSNTIGGAQLLDTPGRPGCGLNARGIFDDLPGGSGGGGTAVPDSGRITCTQAAPGGRVSVSITGTDTSIDPADLPTNSVTNGVIAGGTKAYVVSGYIRIWVPSPAAGDSFPATNTYTPIRATSLSGQQNYGAAGEPLQDNASTINLSDSGSGTGSKTLGRVTDTGAVVANSGREGNPWVTPGTLMRARVTSVNAATRPAPAVTCDVFDNRHQQLAPNGSGVYAESRNAPGGVIQYAAHAWTTAEDARTADCGDADGPWYSSPSQVPGGAAAVGAVRLSASIPAGARHDLLLYLRVQDAPNTTKLRDFGQLSRDGGRTWTHDQNPAEDANGGLADFNIVTTNLARITKKTVDEGFTAADTPDLTQVFTAGHSLEYALYPTLTNATPGAPRETVTVTDVLPRYSRYVPGSGSIAPSAIDEITDSEGKPRERLTWTLPDRTPNVPIAPITYSVAASAVAPPGPVSNFAVISTPLDASDLSARSVIRSVRLVTQDGVAVEKTADAPVVVRGDRAGWTLTARNSVGKDLAGIDVIDVLPHRGDAAGTTVHGTVHLAGVDDPAGHATVRFTGADPSSVSSDAGDPSNADGGATRWCTTDELGTTGCPAERAAATAVRITDPSVMSSGAVTTFHVSVTAPDAQEGDRLVNAFGLRSPDLPLPVSSSPSPVRVVAGAIGDRVWDDRNEDGLQDPGEPGIGDVTVTLHGVDDRGEDVSATTTTDSDGHYGFDGLRPGTYEVHVVAPPHTVVSPRHRGDDTTDDSDFTAAGDTDVTLARTGSGDGLAVERTTTVDAGLHADGTSTIGPGHPDPSTGPGATTGTGGGLGGGATGGHRGGELAFTGAAGLAAAGSLAALLLALGVVLMARTRRRRSETAAE